jgi:hypothetical protein
MVQQPATGADGALPVEGIGAAGLAWGETPAPSARTSGPRSTGAALTST